MPKKNRKADATTFKERMQGHFKLQKAQRAEKVKASTPNEILPGWESPPKALNLGKDAPYKKPRERKFSFKNASAFGGFLFGETNRFLRNAEAAAKRMAKAAKKKGGTTYYKRSQDQVVRGEPEPETPQLKTKKGYRTGNVPKVGGPVVTRIDERSHKPAVDYTNLEYMYGKKYRNTDAKSFPDLKSEKMHDVNAYIKTNPLGVAHYMEKRRLQKLKKKEPDKYQLEKTAVVGVGAGLIGYKAFKAGKRYYKEFNKFTKDL
jgi:hypothetical protein